MKIARKPTKPEMAELVDFIFDEALEDFGLSGWWEFVLPPLTILLKRLGAIIAVRLASIRVVDGCWLQGEGYVDRVMTVQWQPKQMKDEPKATFIWLQDRLELMPPGMKYWQRNFSGQQV
jgi:hypothetical protein